MNKHPLRCRCGTLRGEVSMPERVSRGVCYCRDCQAFARFLGRADEILDEMGGTDVVATLPQRVTFTQGQEALACMSLSEKGMLRWFAGCCNTPIGNTPRDYRLSHVGLVHNCLEEGAPSLDASFGPVRMRVNTKSAKGKPAAMLTSTVASVLRFMVSLLGARLDGSYKQNPFFDTERGVPIVSPKVLTVAERERLMNPV